MNEKIWDIKSGGLLNLFKLYDRISRRIWHGIRKYFGLFIRAMDGFVSWKIIEVENLVTHSLQAYWNFFRNKLKRKIIISREMFSSSSKPATTYLTRNQLPKGGRVSSTLLETIVYPNRGYNSSTRKSISLSKDRKRVQLWNIYKTHYKQEVHSHRSIMSGGKWNSPGFCHLYVLNSCNYLFWLLKTLFYVALEWNTYMILNSRIIQYIGT